MTSPPRRRGPRGRTIPAGPVLAGFLRRERRARGLTQNELGALAGISREQYNRYEGGKRGLEEENAVKLAAALGLDPEVLFSLAEEAGAIAEMAVQLAELQQRVAHLEQRQGSGS